MLINALVVHPLGDNATLLLPRASDPSTRMRATSRVCSSDSDEAAAIRRRTMAGKFELYKSSNGEYRFRLKAGNGEIIATSEGYASKASAKNGIESVKTNAAGAPVDDQTD